MDKELIAEVIIPKYIRKVQVSGNRRPSYYKQGEKLPLKYSSKLAIDYQWIRFKNGKVLLCNANQEPIVKNPTSAGTPKYKIINGQDLHALTLQDYERSKIITVIKLQMIPEVEKLDIINDYPIIIEAELYDTFEDMELLSTKGKVKDIRYDIDNRFLMYGKTFPDVLSGCLSRDNDTGDMVCTSKPIIADDNRRYITNSMGCLFYPIENTEERKLVFKIYKDLRPEITSNRHYGL